MLNYKQLYYFWNVAKSGGVIRAAKQLNITPQTISHQVGELEKALEINLFRRVGKRMELTPAGELILSRADDIFRIGHEIELLVKDNELNSGFFFRVGVVDTVPKSIAHELINESLNLQKPFRLVCNTDSPERLFDELATHHLDIVISDKKIPGDFGVKAYNHRLGQSGVTFCATRSIVNQLNGTFPDSLNNARFLLPPEGTSLRTVVDQWFSKKEIRPTIVGEFADPTLLTSFGNSGLGIFPVPSVIADEIVSQFEVEVIGSSKTEKIDYFAISHEHRLKHPAVIAITNMAGSNLFQTD